MKAALSSPLFLLFALFGGASAKGSCACESEELGFKIDCADTATMLDALNFLNTNSCATVCSSVDCVRNYYIVQSHHDYCPESDIPETVEDGFHDYDEACTGCEIKRDFVEGAPNCPAPNCGDSSGNDAYTSLIENGCNLDCSSDTCRDLFFTLRTVHDGCPHDTLSRASEEGLHDLERPCADQICNQADGSSNQLVCDPHGSSAFEWAGVFATDDATHVWSMQAIDGEYADPSMRLVFFAVDVPGEDAIESNEAAGETMIEGDSCLATEAGETIGPISNTGSCFELRVGSTPDSTYTINTVGVAAIVVFAQHVPIEFERDAHYLKDSAGVDIEPLAEEGGGGHAHDHAHDHGGDDEESGAGVVGSAAAAGVAALVGSVLVAA